MKKCCKCNELKPITEFSKNRSTKDGLQRECKSCRKSVQREHYQLNKEKSFIRAKRQKEKYKKAWDEYKETLECTVCGENHAPCLDFHHLDPSEKDFNISQKVKDMSLERIKLEIEKCVVLCANCHRKVHSGFISL